MYETKFILTFEFLDKSFIDTFTNLMKHYHNCKIYQIKPNRFGFSITILSAMILTTISNLMKNE